MKRIIASVALMMMCAIATWADSPLTSTDFHQAYATHPMVELAADFEPGSMISTTLLQFLADDQQPTDVRLAVINRLGWSFDGNDSFLQLGEYLMKKHKAKNLDKMTKKLNPKTLAVYAYAMAMRNYFDVKDASRLASMAVKRDKEHCLSIAMVDALIKAQIYLDDDWSLIYPTVAGVLNDGSLKLDMRQSAIDIIMDYINCYQEYAK